MKHLYQTQTDQFSILYLIVRILLGAYLIYHASLNLFDFDAFYLDSINYTNDSGYQSMLGMISPFLPFIELFIGVLILTGLYTSVCLRWSILLGIIVTAFLHFNGDFQGALWHTYLIVAKVILVSNLYYNRLSVDYYQLWQVYQEHDLIETQDYIEYESLK
ncbi:hypothetical protein FNJ87_16020 [Nonlabens mediterrranea]|uniref:Methylamine utilisation protein MauE domain-containing protein n=1 Tax=Nonlabens mediterrranea TaxID=1419947 RepID=A0ABS0A9G7_9FLAO|nr:hypothetical protein BBFL7_00627 [Flavobacteria bacterium BBFL7]MBF4985766.1 hypothetical protein [Nonlabens mediterrranea]